MTPDEIRKMPLSELERITKHHELHPQWSEISKEYYQQIHKPHKKPFIDTFGGRLTIAIIGGTFLFFIGYFINKYILSKSQPQQPPIQSQSTSTTEYPKKIKPVPSIPPKQQNNITDKERARRSIILSKLRNLYILSHDGISPEFASGLAPMPKEWVEEQLTKLGETWRQDQYY